MTRIVLALVALIVTTPACSATEANDLEAGFHNPPSAAKPWVSWFWMNGNICRDGRPCRKPGNNI